MNVQPAHLHHDKRRGGWQLCPFQGDLQSGAQGRIDLARNGDHLLDGLG